MSNCEVFSLPPVEVECHQVREVLRCLLNSILFCRALGFVRPCDVDSDLLSTQYVIVSDPEVQAQLEQQIGEFGAVVEKRPPNEMAQVRLSFYERRQRPAWLAAKFADDRRYWEQWCINLLVSEPKSQMQQQEESQVDSHQPSLSVPHLGSRGGGTTSSPGQPSSSAHAAAASSRLATTLEAARLTITRCVSDKRDHIPPVVSASTITFPFDITSSIGGRSPFSLSNVKRMLLHTSPPPMLQ